MKREFVYIVIVNYKSSELIRGLLESVHEDDVDVKILILDNGSTEQSWQELKEIKDERLCLIRSTLNLGFTGGVNYLIKYAVNNLDFSDYFFLLNPDALCCRNLISELLQNIKSDHTIAGISPQIVDLNNQQWYSGARIQYNKGIVVNNALSAYIDDKGYEVDVFSGCAVLFNTQKFMEAGMFNNDLFMYYDEAELSMKLSQLGYKLMYIPSLKIMHDVSYTTKKMSHLKIYYLTRNKLLVFNEHLSFYYKCYFLIYQFAYHIKNFRFKCSLYHLLGYWDYLRGKKGIIK